VIGCVKRIDEFGQRAGAELSEQELQPLEACRIEGLTGRSCAPDRARQVPRPRTQEGTNKAVESFEFPLPAQLIGDLSRAIPELVERRFAFDMKNLFESLLEILDREDPRT